MFFGEPDQIRPVVARRRGPLRVGGRTDIGDGSAVQNVLWQAGVIRQMAGVCGGRNKDRLGPDRQSRNHIDLIERVRTQHDGLLAALGFRTQRHGSVIEPLTRTVQRHDLCVRIHGDAIAAVDPAGNRAPQRVSTFVLGISTEQPGIFHDHIRHPRTENHASAHQ